MDNRLIFFDMSKQKTSSGEDRAFWQLVLDSHRNSGISVNKFCEKEGISPSSFYNWRKKIEGDHRPISEKPEAQLDIKDNSEAGFLPIGQLDLPAGGLTISFPSGICVNVSNNCDTALLCSASKRVDFLVGLP